MSTKLLNVKPSECRAAVTNAIKAKLVPMVHGSPGIGKSAIVHAIAGEFNLKVIDLRLSQCDPTDLLGFPKINEETNKAGYVPMETFPIAGDPLPAVLDADGKQVYEKTAEGQKAKHYNGWLLFLDELPTAPPAVQAAAYKLILDRMIGVHHLHKNVAIVGAGNLESDNALVQPMSTALQSRLMHLTLRLDVSEWLEWARTTGVDYRVTSFIGFQPANLHRFDPNHTDYTFPSPRTWHFVDSALKVCSSTNDPSFEYMAAGCIGDGMATEFINFCRVESELPKFREIVANPEGCKLPQEASIQWLLSGFIGANIAMDNADQVMKYVARLPAEFQVISLREAVKRNTNLVSQPSVQKWIIKAGSSLV